ncbi:MAG: CTP synthase (glutamine hydrolyzing) [Candidatus Woesearchaeota archaeon]
MPKTKDMFIDIASKSEEHEFYSPVPEGYRIGKTKYVVVFGTVMSGLGKGIFSSSLGKLLQMKGLKVAPIKFDGYLNVDAGTLNPYRHGEVFVLDDGMECDMDLGNYERFLELDLTRNNYLTGGKIFSNVLKMERKGEYLGRDVQIIPHVTGFIKHFLRSLAMNQKADIVCVEVGGTVGDIENGYFIEAMRELSYEEGMQNVCNVALTYVLEPDFLGEQKSKAAQLGITSLMAKGIQPNIIACRATNPVTEKVREKISIYSNVTLSRVVSIHDVKSIYEIPIILKDSNIDQAVIDILNLRTSINKIAEIKKTREWTSYVKNLKELRKTISIGITGKYTGLRDSYSSIINALEHAGNANDMKINIKWIETSNIKDDEDAANNLKGVSGIIVPGGFGKRGTEGKILCIKHARENNLPYLGLCFGFQMAIIEYARNVIGLEDANSTELKHDCLNPVVDILPEQKRIEGLGGNMRLGGRDIEVVKDSQVYHIYGKKTMVRERFRHRFEFNPKYKEQFEQKGLIFSGKAPNQPIMQFLELKDHPFFIGIQAHPEFTSRPLRPNPLYNGFIKACLK